MVRAYFRFHDLYLFPAAQCLSLRSPCVSLHGILFSCTLAQISHDICNSSLYAINYLRRSPSMTFLCFSDAVGRPHFHCSKGSLYAFIIAINLLWNRSPSEWFLHTKGPLCRVQRSFLLLSLIFVQQLPQSGCVKCFILCEAGKKLGDPWVVLNLFRIIFKIPDQFLRIFPAPQKFIPSGNNDFLLIPHAFGSYLFLRLVCTGKRGLSL